MLQDKYQFDGILPFPRSGMILINGISQEHKNVATFIGTFNITPPRRTNYNEKVYKRYYNSIN